MGDPEPAGGDDPRAALQRELYWASEPGGAAPGPLRDLRRRLEELADTLHADLSRPFPSRDPLLEAGSPWRRALKRFLYRFLRPFTRRHDRIAAELAGMHLELLDHVARLRADVGRVEDEILRLGGDAGTAEPGHPGAGATP